MDVVQTGKYAKQNVTYINIFIVSRVALVHKSIAGIKPDKVFNLYKHKTYCCYFH